MSLGIGRLLKTPDKAPLIEGCLQSLGGTAKPQSRAHHLLRAGHVIHSHKHTVELVKQKTCILRKQRG